MKEMREAKVDPLQECLKAFETDTTVSDTNKYSNGILIFMHGSPCEGNSIISPQDIILN